MKLSPLHAHPDVAAVRALLATSGRPTADLAAAPLADFWGCGEGTALIGVIGLEGYGTVALLRSLAVAPDWQGRGLETALLAYAERAERFCTRRGYVRLPREATPRILHQTAEFAARCPASAACLTKVRSSRPICRCFAPSRKARRSFVLAVSNRALSTHYRAVGHRHAARSRTSSSRTRNTSTHSSAFQAMRRASFRCMST